MLEFPHFSGKLLKNVFNRFLIIYNEFGMIWEILKGFFHGNVPETSSGGWKLLPKGYALFGNRCNSNKVHINALHSK